MKRIFNIKYILSAVLGSALLLSSCNYLDVIPPEQPDLGDANKTYESSLAFLYSCYAGVKSPMDDYSNMESASDEWILPPLWNEGFHKYTRDLETPESVVDWRWGHYYQFIGQCHLFVRELKGAKDVSEDEKKEWLGEIDFLLGFYHMQLLNSYGPIPITDEYIDMGAPNSKYPGRSHYDYVVDYIVKKFDSAAAVLPATRNGEKWGRATSVMAKGYKSRLLVYAASPLWNGEFPFPAWKNTNYETPGYGLELVSKTYDPKKWARAEVAAKEALDFALKNGYELYNDMEQYSREGIALPYVPGIDTNSEEGKLFLKKVMLMRYLVTTRVNQGNKEIIWGHTNNGNIIWGSLPHSFQKHNNGSNIGGYSGVSPLLSTTASYFYTVNGKRPAYDPLFTSQDQWFKSANVNGRKEIINFNVNREPRFYAWLGFDGGDYTSSIKNGSPIRLNLRDKNTHGMNLSLYPRDNNATGYFNQKFIPARSSVNLSNQWTNHENKPRPMMRLAELYLNLAEAYAAQGKNAEAIDVLNKVRTRAGVPALKNSDVGTPMTMMEWVQNERFIELWAEGHRYYDVRRWMTAPQTMAEGKRTGLNALAMENPSFEVFNTPTVVDQPFVWTSRMYLRPLYINEVYKNPQMIQSPGY